MFLNLNFASTHGASFGESFMKSEEIVERLKSVDSELQRLTSEYCESNLQEFVDIITKHPDQFENLMRGFFKALATIAAEATTVDRRMPMLMVPNTVMSVFIVSVMSELRDRLVALNDPRIMRRMHEFDLSSMPSILRNIDKSQHTQN